MKQTSQHIILFIAAVISLYALSLPSCSNLADRTVRDKLALVDILLLSDPDAALDTLATLPDSIAHPATAAWRDLLTVKAKIRSHRLENNYLAEKEVYEYYKGAHDSIEYQSAYYFGSKLSYCDHNDSALIVLTDALDLSLEQGDMFYAAMTTRALSNLYGNILVAPKELEYAIRAKQYFTEANRPVHAAWQDLMIISGLYLNDRYDEALDVINNIDSVYLNNDTFRDLLNNKKVTMFSIYNKHDEVISTYREMIDDGHAMTEHDWCLLANSLVGLGKWHDAESALANINSDRLNEADSVYRELISARIFAGKGDFNRAYHLAIKGGYSLNKISEGKLLNPETVLLSDYLELKAKSKTTEAKLARKNAILTIIYMTIIALMLIVIIIVLYKKKKSNALLYKLKEITLTSLLQDKDWQLKSNKVVYESQNKEHEATIKDLNQMIADLKQVIDKLKTDDTANTANMAFINSICNTWANYVDEVNNNTKLSTDEKDRRFIKRFSKQISKLSDTKFINRQVELKDRGNGYPLSLLRIILPNISNDDYKLMAYSYIGFDAVTIAVLTGRASKNAIYQAKHRLKDRIEASQHPQAKSFIDSIWENQ